jgi:hypothetical protein
MGMLRKRLLAMNPRPAPTNTSTSVRGSVATQPVAPQLPCRARRSEAEAVAGAAPCYDRCHDGCCLSAPATDEPGGHT